MLCAEAQIAGSEITPIAANNNHRRISRVIQFAVTGLDAPISKMNRAAPDAFVRAIQKEK